MDSVLTSAKKQILRINNPLSSLLSVAGYAGISYGIGMWVNVAAGIIAAGVSCLVMSVQVESTDKPR